jgi:hypothetical protein
LTAKGRSDAKSPDLGSYLTAHPPKGIGADLSTVEKLIRDDPEALAMFRDETTGKREEIIRAMGIY